MPVIGTDPGIQIAAPDYDQINLGSPVALVDGIRLIWNTLQNEISDRKRQRFQWSDVPYNSGMFGASAGTWTVTGGMYTGFKFAVENDFLFLTFNFTNTTTSAGMGTTLTFLLPSGLTAVSGGVFFGMGIASNNINEVLGITIGGGTNQQVQLNRIPSSTSFPSNVTTALTIQGAMFLEVNT